ncbi:hypothetical protein L288_13060 [Sphingobium quisquiliarum P25]|uniref:Uncharacterized protein n=1 Tax=Sphingobium quisquiliarum P25 TaxID=1329909 RepID=T0GND8_9SPHN|nr:hypothetical protein [Sphingobium quisquiliarum]EQB05336.1 hypothetical protein L288_13060 [Sphingobium quisquiliarum P25]
MMVSGDRQTVVVIPPDAIRLGAGANASEYRAMLRLLSSDVTAICKAQWPSNSTDCNAFVKAVAGNLGVTLTGNADSIVDQISGSGWTSLEDGVAASAAAADGKLVVGGLKAKDLGSNHGHVVIVVPPTGPLAHGKYPYAYWGSLDDGDVRKNGGLGTTVNYSFNTATRDKVVYASIDI